MPVINTHIKRAPKTVVDGMRVLEQPYRLFPEQVRASFDKKALKGEKFTAFGYTLQTRQKDNMLLRTYYGHNGHDWVTVGILTGSPVATRVRYEEA